MKRFAFAAALLALGLAGCGQEQAKPAAAPATSATPAPATTPAGGSTAPAPATEAAKPEAAKTETVEKKN